MTTYQSTKVCIIYAGGTFGSHGQPLNSLEPSKFLPILQNILNNDFKNNNKFEILPNDVVKDSSQLTPSDFAHFYALILQYYQQGIRQFVILTGTDTLGYLSAFLAESLANSDICLVLTGAMQPLLDPLSPEYTVNLHSDASKNLWNSYQLAMEGKAGVKVCFGDETWSAQTVQKLHSHEMNAFVGYESSDYPANSFQVLANDERKYWLQSHIQSLDMRLHNLQKAKILPIFVVPILADNLANQLQNTLEQQPDAIVLLGFGAGNLPRNANIEQLLQQAQQQNCLVVIGTQCAFGGVSASYEAGAWLGRCGVVSAGNLTIPAIFARLLWLSADDITIQQKQQIWQTLLLF